jgi:hypothetical protein
MHDTTRPPCPRPRSGNVAGNYDYRFARNAVLVTITLVWLIGQGWTAYVQESRINRDGHRNAVVEGCGSQSGRQEVQHSRLD